MNLRESYKQTEVGIIPEDWKVVKLGDILDYEQPTRYLVETTEYNDSYNIPVLTAGKTFILGYTNETEGVFNNKLPVIIFDDFTTASKYVNFPFKAKSSAMKILKVKNREYPIKLFYEYMKQLNFIPATHKRYWISEYSKFKIPLPPLEEQKKIAKILSTTDEKIAFVTKSIEETETLKKGLMQKLLTEGVGHTEFKDSEIGRIPVEWEVSTLQEVSDFITKGATPTTYGFKWEESGIPFLRSECVTSKGLNLKGAMFISSEANEYMNRSEIKSGDLLMTITGNVGKVIVLEDSFLSGNINQHIARIRVSSKNVDKLFIYHFLSQDKYRMNYYKITTGQAYPQISLKQVRESKFPLPSLEEQQQISKILSTTDEKLEKLREKKESFEELKKGLMQKLLTGEIRV